MVIMGISPGLANQMYEYAAAYALARELNQELVLDISECVNAPWGYLLDFFSIPSVKKLVYFADDIEHSGHTDIARIPESLKLKSTVFTADGQNGTVQYDSLCDVRKDYSDNIYLCGYFFERDKYYDKYWNDIRNSFALKVKIREIERFCNLIKDKISVGVHIRRGDMLLADWAVKMEDNFYRAAIAYCRKYFGKCIFAIFSDDIAYAKEMLGKDSSLYYIHFIGHQDADIAEFICLSFCNHRILSNSSTFGRLADELNMNERGRTFYQVSKLEQRSRISHFIETITPRISLFQNSKYIIRFDQWDLKKYNKRYKQDKKENIMNYKERVNRILKEKITEKNCEIVLDEIAELSLNTYDLSIKNENQLMYQKFQALVNIKDYHTALTVATPIYEMYADDFMYRDNLIESLTAIGAHREAGMEKKRSTNRKQFVIIPAGQTCASSRRYGLIEVGIILHHLGHQVAFILNTDDKTEEYFIKNETLVNRRGIDSGCKVYQQKNIKKDDFTSFLNGFHEEELFILTRSRDYCGQKTEQKRVTYIFLDFMDQRDAESKVGQRMPKEDVEYLYNNADIIMTHNADDICNGREYILWKDNDHSEEYWLEDRRWEFGDLDRFSERAISIAETVHEYVQI